MQGLGLILRTFHPPLYVCNKTRSDLFATEPARASARPDVSVRRVKSEALAVALRIWAAASDDLPLKGRVMDRRGVRVTFG